MSILIPISNYDKLAVKIANQLALYIKRILEAPEGRSIDIEGSLSTP